MCGIVGYVGRRECAPILLEGLGQLEYRGYDSAGLAVCGPAGLRVVRKAGRLGALREAMPRRLAGRTGIAHTRWATQGEPSDGNAHPHLDASGRIAIVHNGIIENAPVLRARLGAAGVELASETDSEVLAHLIAAELAPDRPLEDAVRRALAAVEGTYGLAVLDRDRPETIVAARNGAPVIVGVGEREMLVASDIAALVRHTTQVVHLDDGELAVLDRDGFRTLALDATPTQKRPFSIDWSLEQYDRDGYAHFMRKEIHEQPAALRRALSGRIDERFATAHLGGVGLSPREVLAIRRVKLLGCGTAYYAGLAGAQLIEGLARIPADAEPASEFRYRNPVIEPDVLYVAVSQSGETADTLAAVHEVQRKGGQVLGVVNVVGSSIARACDGIYLHAGPEVSVASTKVFTSMLASIGLLALGLGRVRDLGPADGARLIRGLRRLPEQVEQVLAREAEVAAVAAQIAEARSMLFVGRNRGYPIALEGAQKLKEISYIHAEAYPAGELKHGPLALVSPELPTLLVIPDDELFDKSIATAQQIRARRGPLVAVGQERAAAAQAASVAAGEPLFDALLEVPRSEPELDPVLLVVPLQLLAYHASVLLGRDVDQPRNLAKSVTVE